MCGGADAGTACVGAVHDAGAACVGADAGDVAAVVVVLL
jgi:hypothetical protein